jgi:hypothetical protein
MTRRGLELLLLIGASLLLATVAQTQKRGRVVTISGMEGADRAPEMRRDVSLGLLDPLRECMDNVDGKAPRAPVILQLLLRFGPSGKLGAVSADASENAPAPFVACAKRRARRLRLDSAPGGGVQAVQTYVLLPTRPSRSTAPQRAPHQESTPKRNDPARFAPTTPIIARLEPKDPHPVARLARQLRARVEACTEPVPGYAGAVTVQLLAKPDGEVDAIAARARPPEALLTRCVHESLAASKLPSHSGSAAWKVRLEFFVGDGVSLVR